MISRCNSPRKPQRKPKPSEAQFAHRRAQGLEVVGVGREETAEHHGNRRLEARQHLGHRLPVVGDGVADAGVGDFLDRGGDEADLAGAKLVDLRHLRCEEADAFDVIGRARAHHADPAALLHDAVDDADQHNHAEIDVIPAVDQQRLQGRIAIALRRRQARDDRLQHVGNAKAGLGRDHHRVGGVDADDVLDLLLDLLRLRGRKVDLVQDRNDLMTRVERVVDVGKRLRFDALAGVHHQQGTLARRQRPRDFVGEVDMAGRVHQVEDVILAVLGAVGEADRLRLDGDAALALDVHGIEHLLLARHFAVGQAPGHLDQAVGQRRFAMVDMGDDGEIADVGNGDGRHGRGIPLTSPCGNHIAVISGPFFTPS
jgi:hypothetical protein